MHPGDHAGAVFIQIGFIEGAADQLVGDQGRLPYDLVGQHIGSIQGIHDFCGNAPPPSQGTRLHTSPASLYKTRIDNFSSVT